MPNSLRRILFAEDNAHDVEMTLETFEEHHIANEVIVVTDGAEALDYLDARGKYQGRTAIHNAVPRPAAPPERSAAPSAP